jgi:hypothetical protein
MKVTNLTSGHAQAENENDSIKTLSSIMQQKIGSCTKMKVHNARQYLYKLP